MKKQLLLFAFSALVLTSCDDDDMQGYELDMMKGDWKTSKTEVISGKDNKTVISSTTPTGCGAKDITYFGTDYSTSYTYYSGNGADCQINGKPKVHTLMIQKPKNGNILFKRQPETL